MAEDKLNLAAHPLSLDERIVLTLETAPAIAIPVDFAARITSQLPAIPSLRQARYGYRAAGACLVLLLALMAAFAQSTATSVFWLSMESIFCAQFSLLAVWLVARNAGYRFTNLF